MLIGLEDGRLRGAWWKLLLAGLALMLLSVVPLASCRELPRPVTTYPVTTTIEEAGRMLGVVLPVPTYLPTGCKIREVRVNASDRVSIEIYDDERIYFIGLGIGYWREILLPHKMGPGYKTAFKVAEEKNGYIWWGHLWEQPDRWHLLWPLRDAYGKGGFDVSLYVSKNISEEEAIKIALSVRQPDEATGGCSPWRRGL
ncbi:MAG: hypothetical protein AB1597_02085 [Chloroflexota bacterium]